MQQELKLIWQKFDSELHCNKAFVILTIAFVTRIVD